jgi:hypothetical protein
MGIEPFGGVMSAVDEFVAARIEHIKTGGRGSDKDSMRRAEALWETMTPEEKRDAEKRYFAETLPLLVNKR